MSKKHIRHAENALVEASFRFYLRRNTTALPQDTTKMAYTVYSRRPLGISTRAALKLVGLVSRINDWNVARRTRNELSKLSAHELNDIGLERGDIDRIAGGRF